MNRNKALTSGLGLLIAATATFGLTACGGDTTATEPGGTPAAEETAQAEVDIAEDLENARQAVAGALAEDDSWAQIMLASDVEAPTVKYGLLVVPYTYSDAAARVQGTIQITDGSEFTIEAESAATGLTWQIDQDGAITEVTD